jgi:hypothetical protein
VSVVNNRIVSVSVEARSRRKERREEADKRRWRHEEGEKGERRKRRKDGRRKGKDREKQATQDAVTTGPDSRTCDIAEWQN